MSESQNRDHDLTRASTNIHEKQFALTVRIFGEAQSSSGVGTSFTQSSTVDTPASSARHATRVLVDQLSTAVLARLRAVRVCVTQLLGRAHHCKKNVTDAMEIFLKY